MRASASAGLLGGPRPPSTGSTGVGVRLPRASGSSSSKKSLVLEEVDFPQDMPAASRLRSDLTEIASEPTEAGDAGDAADEMQDDEAAGLEVEGDEAAEAEGDEL